MRGVLTANLLAQSKMEQYNALPSSAVPTSVACCTSFKSATNEFDPASEGDYSKFSYEMTKTTVVAGYIDQITLIVHYKVFAQEKTMTYVMLKGLR